MVSKLGRYVGITLTLLAFYYLVSVFISLDISSLRKLNVWVMVVYIPLLIGIYIPLVLLGGYSWKLILEYFHKKPIPIRLIFPIFASSNFAKYIPGTVMQYVVRNLLGQRLKLRQKDIALSSVFEIIFLVITYGILLLIFLLLGLGDLFLPSLAKMMFIDIPFYLIILALSLAVLFILVFRHFLWITARRVITFVFDKRFILLFTQFFVVNTIMFLMIGLLYSAMFPIFFHTGFLIRTIMYVDAIFILSAFIGYIVPGSPAGIGVREYFLLLWLSPMFGEGPVLLVSLVHRIVTILSDFFIQLLGVVVEKLYSTKNLS